MTKAHRMMLATVKQNLGSGCRPRGRRVASGGSRLNQATTVGWLGAQGAGEINGCFTTTVESLVRRGELIGDEQGDGKKIEQGSGDKWRRPRLNSVAQKRKEATQETSPCQREAEDIHERA